jgi:hypothetical protein
MKRLVLLATLCAHGIWCTGVQGRDPTSDTGRSPHAAVSLLSFQMSETSVELGFRIKNQSDHEIWVCESVAGNLQTKQEVFLSADQRTLVVRRRFDVPGSGGWNEPPLGEYVRLLPDEERTESLSLVLPVSPRVVFYSEEPGQAEYATRLNLEIGFYDVNLPRLVRDIIVEAQKFSSAIDPAEWPFLERYFPGLVMAQYLPNVSDYDWMHQAEIKNARFLAHYISEPRLGEQTLRIEINGVHVPYEKPKPPSSDLSMVERNGEQ